MDTADDDLKHLTDSLIHRARPGGQCTDDVMVLLLRAAHSSQLTPMA
ncbi:hypothetical protein ACIRU3_24855 [Streptomyces sp. NPDC101151]